MEIEKYTPSSLSVGAILGLIASGDIAIPENQRPFVWKKTQVRDLLDSLYVAESMDGKSIYQISGYTKHTEMNTI